MIQENALSRSLQWQPRENPTYERVRKRESLLTVKRVACTFLFLVAFENGGRQWIVDGLPAI